MAEDDIRKNTTLCFRAPEMVDLYRAQLINWKVDIWVRHSRGCFFFFLFCFAVVFALCVPILRPGTRLFPVPDGIRQSPLRGDARNPQLPLLPPGTAPLLARLHQPHPYAFQKISRELQ